MSATLRYKYDVRRRTVYHEDGDDIGAVTTLAYNLQQYSQAHIERVTVSAAEWLAGTEIPGDVDMDFFAKIFARDTETLNPCHIIVVAPFEWLFTEYDGGLIVKPEYGTAITNYYATFSGRQLVFEHGALCGRSRG